MKRRSWIVLILAAVVFVLSLGLLFYALYGSHRSSASAAATTASSTEMLTFATTTARDIDGVFVDASSTHLLPFAVMIDQHPDALPTAGVSFASLVFELPVEGGLTRLMAVYDASTTVESIGPVRSARPYAVDFVDGLQAVYAHVGGSPEALDALKSRSSNVHNVDEMKNGDVFWRSSKRVAPHQVFTSTAFLRELADRKNWKVGSWTAWQFTDDDLPSASATATQISVPSGTGGAVTKVTWAYDAATKTYARFEDGDEAKENDGGFIQTHNVIYLFTSGSSFDEKGRLHIRTTGRGRAVVYRNGGMQELVWKRQPGAFLQFETVDGAAARFSRGQTWVHVILDGF